MAALNCPVCGDDVFVQPKPVWYDGANETCQGCGTILTIKVDDDDEDDAIAYPSAGDEIVEDKGQPKCDGGCGAVPRYIGTPCRWDCTEHGSALKGEGR